MQVMDLNRMGGLASGPWEAGWSPTDPLLGEDVVPPPPDVRRRQQIDPFGPPPNTANPRTDPGSEWWQMEQQQPWNDPNMQTGQMPDYWRFRGGDGGFPINLSTGQRGDGGGQPSQDTLGPGDTDVPWGSGYPPPGSGVIPWMRERFGPGGGAPVGTTGPDGMPTGTGIGSDWARDPSLRNMQVQQLSDLSFLRPGYNQFDQGGSTYVPQDRPQPAWETGASPGWDTGRGPLYTDPGGSQTLYDDPRYTYLGGGDRMTSVLEPDYSGGFPSDRFGGGQQQYPIDTGHWGTQVGGGSYNDTLDDRFPSGGTGAIDLAHWGTQVGRGGWDDEGGGGGARDPVMASGATYPIVNELPWVVGYDTRTSLPNNAAIADSNEGRYYAGLNTNPTPPGLANNPVLYNPTPTFLPTYSAGNPVMTGFNMAPGWAGSVF